MDLYSLRHTAKEILAAAVLELFPTVQLVGGEVDEIGFSYEFLFPKNILTLFSQKEFEHIEDQMIRIVQEDLPIKTLEMMRENGAAYLEHLHQPLRAKAALSLPSNIIPIIEFGSFRDACPLPFLNSTGEVKAFKLQKFETIGEKVCLYGTAFPDKTSLKTFLKKYKEAAQNDPNLIGSKYGYFIDVDGKWIYLEKGISLINRLKDFWDKEHEKFTRLAYEDSLGQATLHHSIFSMKKFKELAHFSFCKGDFVSMQYQNDEELFDKLISSLHLIEKAFKIFAFEMRVYCEGPKSGLLSELLKETGLVFDQGKRMNPDEERIIVCTPDRYGREKILSYLTVERKVQVLHRSIFCSIKEWMARMIERGVEI